MKTPQVTQTIIPLYNGKSYTLPKVPPKSEILFHDLPKAKQKWVRPDVEQEWEDAEDKLAFEKKELFRRIYGVWFYNNGEPTYITGDHYYELTYCKFAFGYCDFRDTAKRWFYWWDLCVKDDTCLGSLRAKFRRLGATSDGESIALNTATSTTNILCGLVSKTNQDAKDTFNEIVDVLQNVPHYAIPPMEGKDRPKAVISFKEPSRTLTHKNTSITKSNSLNSRIDYRATTTNAYDGKPVKFLFVDESAKWTKETPFTTFWDIHKSCLIKGGTVYGKAYLPSTINEMELSGGKEYKSVWDLSDHNDLNDNKRTKSGLWRYFNPAFDGLEGFIDEYGFSVIDTPTPAQAKFIGRKIGAKEFLQNERKALEKFPDRLYEYIRQFPFDEKEAFLTPNKNSQFDLIRIQEQTEWNTSALLTNSLVLQPGNFMWKDGVQDSEVIWMPMKGGRFTISWFPKPENQNRHYLKGAYKFPSFHNEGCLGIDPIDKAATNCKRQSDYACYGFRYDNLFDKKFSNCFFLQYVYRHPIPEQRYEDMIMACHFYGMPCFGEMNNPGTVNHFTMRGYENYLLDRPEPLRSKGSPVNKKEKWMPSRDLKVRALMMENMQQFIVENVGFIQSVDGFLEFPKIPFNELLNELSKYTSDEDLTDYDSIVAAIYALSTRQRNMKPKQPPKQSYTPFVAQFKKHKGEREF